MTVMRFEIHPSIAAEEGGWRIRLKIETKVISPWSSSGGGSQVEYRDFGVWPLTVEAARILAQELGREELAWRSESAQRFVTLSMGLEA